MPEVSSWNAWLVLGLTGQLLFSARFLVQWLRSEREGRSVVPTSFWILSLFGSGALLAYAIHRQDPVFILGQSAGIVIYLRNLALLRRVAGGVTDRSESAAAGA